MESDEAEPGARALPRHVSVDGCQLVLGGQGARPGQRFRLDLAGIAPISGTVRWAVADRVGFAFDRPLCPAGLSALSQRGTRVRELTLLPA